MKFQVKLSEPSKMPCYTWSISAFDTCPGAVNNNAAYSGYLKDYPKFRESMQKSDQVDVCKGCYAQYGNYSFPAVIKHREYNEQDWQKADFVKRMVFTIKGNDMKYFRFFDSGDIYCVELAEKILEICKACSDTKFWIPTRSWKIMAIRKVLDSIRNLPNAMVRYSSDSINGKTIPFRWNSTVVPNNLTKSKKNFLVCQAFARDGKCGDCRACWNKNVKTIAYPAHGIVMKSNLKKMAV